jgi:hypothetical protein
MIKRFTVDENKSPKFRASHVAMSAFSQELCNIIVTQVLKHVNKDKDGLFNISRKDVRYAIDLNDDLNAYFNLHLRRFDKTLSYEEQLCISENAISKFIDDNINKNIKFTDRSYNLLSYLLLKALIDVVDLAQAVGVFAKKGSIGWEAVIFAVKQLFKESAVSDALILKISECMKLIDAWVDKDENKEESNNVGDNDNDNDNDNDDNDDDDDNNKKSKKNILSNSNDDDDNDNNTNNNDDDNDNDNDNDNHNDNDDNNNNNNDTDNNNIARDDVQKQPKSNKKPSNTITNTKKINNDNNENDDNNTNNNNIAQNDVQKQPKSNKKPSNTITNTKKINNTKNNTDKNNNKK